MGARLLHMKKKIREVGPPGIKVEIEKKNLERGTLITDALDQRAFPSLLCSLSLLSVSVIFVLGVACCCYLWLLFQRSHVLDSLLIPLLVLSYICIQRPHFVLINRHPIKSEHIIS